MDFREVSSVHYLLLVVGENVRTAMLLFPNEIPLNVQLLRQSFLCVNLNSG